jgi:2-polyprenyl-3-methyl-5-hydroxy-6-metoxy-1,4-benzoquinol methylase
MKCPLCGYEKFNYKTIETQEVGTGGANQLAQCLSCSLAFSEDYNVDRSSIYAGNYAAWHESSDNDEKIISHAKRVTFEKQLENLKKYTTVKNKTLLDIGTGNGYLLEAAQDMGFDCQGVDISKNSTSIANKKFPGKIKTGSFLDLDYPDNYFDVITLTDVLEHISDPHGLFTKISSILKTGGIVFIISPNYNSLSRKVLGKKWFQYKYEHVLYYNKKSIEYLIKHHGFQLLCFKNNKKNFSIYYYMAYFKKYSFLKVGKIVTEIHHLVPKKFKNIPFSNPLTGEFMAIIKKQ